MKLGSTALVISTVLGLLALVPLAAAQPAAPPTAPAASGSPSMSVPRPVTGTVTNCTSNWDCKFLFNTSAGKGWANGTGINYYTPGVFAFQLPGEAKASYNLTYTTYIGSLIGTYTYWTVGNFVGTDVNTGHVVYGTTDTNYTITCHGIGHGGCRYTYTTDNGTVVVKFTNAEQTKTSLSCAPTTTHPAGKVSCSVTVTNLWNATNYPLGKVHISSGRMGPISNSGVCPLVNGTCSFTYHPGDNTCGYVALVATYPGSAAFYKSVGSITIAVIVSGGC